MPDPYAPDVKPCEVLADGRWVEGRLLRWTRHEPDGWYGLVEYSLGIGRKYMNVRHESEIRPL